MISDLQKDRPSAAGNTRERADDEIVNEASEVGRAFVVTGVGIENLEKMAEILGFGFDELNCGRLGTSLVHRGALKQGNCYGTSFGMTDSERKVAHDNFGNHTFGWWKHGTALDCIRENIALLSLN